MKEGDVRQVDVRNADGLSDSHRRDVHFDVVREVFGKTAHGNSAEVLRQPSSVTHSDGVSDEAHGDIEFHFFAFDDFQEIGVNDPIRNRVELQVFQYGLVPFTVDVDIESEYVRGVNELAEFYEVDGKMVLFFPAVKYTRHLAAFT